MNGLQYPPTSHLFETPTFALAICHIDCPSAFVTMPTIDSLIIAFSLPNIMISNNLTIYFGILTIHSISNKSRTIFLAYSLS